MSFVPRYPEAGEALQDARSKGRCIMAIGSIQNGSRQGTIAAQQIRNLIGQNTTDLQRSPYFMLVGNIDPSQARVVFSAVISRIGLETEEAEPSTKDYERKIEEKTVKATVTSYRKSAELHIEGTYAIHDAATGELLLTKPFSTGNSWYHSWAVIKGNKEAIEKKSVLREAESKNEPYPTLQKLIETGGEKRLGEVLASAVAAFAKQYS